MFFPAHFASDVQGDSDRPGLELALAGESWQVAEEAEGRFLGCFTGLSGVAEKAEAEAEPHVLKLPQQLSLSVAVAVAGCLDRAGVHATSLVRIMSEFSWAEV